MIEKSPEAFRTISEVAEELDLPQHVLRFWETRFSQIKPMKRGGGRRYYRPEDVNLLKGIRFLLYGEGYTIKGVQRILKEQGARHVATIWEVQDVEEPPAPHHAPVDDFDEPEPASPPPQPVPRPVAAREPARPMSPPPQSAPQPPMPAAAAPAPAGQAPAVQAPVVQAPAVAEPPQVSPRPAGLSAEDTRQLKAALFELIECKRLLDAV